MVRTSTEEIVDIVSQSLEGGTRTHEGKVRCLIMVDKRQYGSDCASEKRHLISVTDPARYSLHLS